MEKNLKTGFKDPLAIKDAPKKEKSPWDFTAPPYDERSSCFISAGDHYGVGHKQPVGLHKAGNSHAVPFGRPETLKSDETG